MRVGARSAAGLKPALPECERGGGTETRPRCSPSWLNNKSAPVRGAAGNTLFCPSIRLVVVLSGLLAGSFSRQGLLDPALFAWLQVKGMSFDFFDDVFLLDLALETAESVLERLSFLKSHFSQTTNTPISV